jgi:hypothetical protein
MRTAIRQRKIARNALGNLTERWQQAWRAEWPSAKVNLLLPDPATTVRQPMRDDDRIQERRERATQKPLVRIDDDKQGSSDGSGLTTNDHIAELWIWHCLTRATKSLPCRCNKGESRKCAVVPPT